MYQYYNKTTHLLTHISKIKVRVNPWFIF